MDDPEDGSGADGSSSDCWGLGGTFASGAVVRQQFASTGIAGTVDGGGRGIRTPGTLPGTTVFKTAALNHSAIPPLASLPDDPSGSTFQARNRVLHDAQQF